MRLERQEEDIMTFRERVKSGMELSSELIGFFAKGKWWWLLPLVLLLVPLGTLFVVAQSSAIAPFIYTLF
jgi:hypothetical protein